jgi:seryl-tRNA synthetase
MIDIELIREDFENTAANLGKRGVEKKELEQLKEVDEKWRNLTSEVEEKRAEQNTAGKELVNLDAAKKEEKIKELKKVSDILKELEGQLAEVAEERNILRNKLPNLIIDDVPVGPDESANKVLRQVGELPEFKFTPKEHWELGQDLNIIDTEQASKVTGSRFSYIKGDLVQLQFALVQLAFSVLTNEKELEKIIEKNDLDVPTAPFIPVVPPVMVRPEVFGQMARLEPKDERYYIESDDLFLVGSAEHTLGPIHIDSTLKEEQLPARYVGYSTSFRREAGSYGKDVRGILRVHQFDKLEIESFTVPEKSTQEQNFIVAIQEHLMQLLELPYQVVAISTGDMGDPDARQIDIETWLPGQNKYRETHSADLMTDYQSRRLKTRVKREDGKVELVHMNDATVFAIGRTLIAIMENYQEEDGSIKVPKALKNFVSFKQIKKA